MISKTWITSRLFVIPVNKALIWRLLPYLGDLGAVDYFRHLRCVVTEELPRSVFASPPLGPMGPPRGVPGRGPPPMRPPHEGGRMKYSEPRPPYNHHGKYCNV